MRLSVVIPIYNAVAYLEDMINSLLAQRLEDMEILLVDDGSTDGSGMLCDRLCFADSRIKSFHIPNGGVSAARNFGLLHAQGEYIHFADADDVIQPGMYEAFVRAISTGSPDMIVCGVVYHRCKLNATECVEGKPVHNASGYEGIREYLYGLSPSDSKIVLNYVWNRWYRRQWLLDKGLVFDTSLSLGEDFMFNCQAFQFVEVLKVIPGSYYHYMIRGDGATGAFYPNIVMIRQMRFHSVRTLYEHYGLWEFIADAVSVEEGSRCFEALCSVNKKRCKLSLFEKYRFIKTVYSSPLMPRAMTYLEYSSDLLHCIAYRLIRQFGLGGACCVVILKKILSLIKDIHKNET